MRVARGCQGDDEGKGGDAGIAASPWVGTRGLLPFPSVAVEGDKELLDRSRLVRTVPTPDAVRRMLAARLRTVNVLEDASYRLMQSVCPPTAENAFCASSVSFSSATS